MFLGYSVLGNSINDNALPSKQSFSKIRLINSGVFDELHVHNTEISQANMLNISTEEKFGSDTVLLAHFQQGVGAGDYDGLDTPIYKYLIYKRKIGDIKYNLFTEVLQSSGVTTLYDFTCINNKKYEYLCLPVGEDENIGDGSLATVKLNFWGWYLSDLQNTQNYKFDLNIESGNIQNVLNISIQNSNSKFPKITQNKQNYIQGSLSTIPYSKNESNYIFDVNILNEIRAFLTDGKVKVLRNTAGEGMLVKISSNPQIKYIDEIQRDGNCPFTLLIDFCQVGELL